jgi:hypothetical protein
MNMGANVNFVENQINAFEIEMEINDFDEEED